MTETPYALGDRVIFTRSLHRRTVSRDSIVGEWPHERTIYRTYKEWTVERWIGDTAPPEPRLGIVIGKRVLANGFLRYAYEEGTTFEPDQRITAYLIAYDMHRNPVYVLPEHITPTTPEETR